LLLLTRRLLCGEGLKLIDLLAATGDLGLYIMPILILNLYI